MSDYLHNYSQLFRSRRYRYYLLSVLVLLVFATILIVNSLPKKLQAIQYASQASGTIYHILSTGQSLSQGYEGYPGLTTTQPYQNLMLNDDSASSTEAALNFTFTPLVEGFVETMSSAMGNTITSLAGNGYQTVITRHGYPAVWYNYLKKGGTVPGAYSPYDRGINQVRIAMREAAKLGKAYKVSALTVVHGEADTVAPTPQDVYESDLLQWINDYNADVKAIDGQTESFPMFTDQVSSYMVSPIAYDHPTIALAQLKASIDYPSQIILVGPKYQFDYVCGVGIHLINTSYRRLGEYYGKVYKQVVIDKKPWIPLSPKNVSIFGSLITLSLNVPVPPIVLDTQQVDLKQNYGFEFWDNSGSPPVITSVAVVGPDTIQIILNKAPVGTDKRLRYAYTGTIGSCAGAHQAGSARGNVRDSDKTPSLYGSHLENWLVHFDLSLNPNPIPSPRGSTNQASTPSQLPISRGAGTTSNPNVVLPAGGLPASQKLIPVTVTSSSSLSGYPVVNVKDGSLTTVWNAGGFAPQWIEFDLGQPRTITKLRLDPAQYPNGLTTHTIYAGLIPAPTMKVVDITGVTNDGTWIEYPLPSPILNARYIRIYTTKNPSWVAWKEIEMYGY